MENQEKRGLAKLKEGYVTKAGMDKTVVVTVKSFKMHPNYGKYIRVTSKYLAHDEQNSCGAGDRVRIIETRPLSKRKRWRVTSILEKAA